MLFIKKEQLILEISLLINEELYKQSQIDYQEYLNTQEYLLKRIDKVTNESK